MFVDSWALEGALGFLFCPKAMCYARLLFLKFKSIATLLLKNLFTASEVQCKHFSMAHKALLRIQLTGSHTLVSTEYLVRGMDGLLRWMFLGPSTSHSCSVGLSGSREFVFLT